MDMKCEYCGDTEPEVKKLGSIVIRHTNGNELTEVVMCGYTCLELWLA